MARDDTAVIETSVFFLPPNSLKWNLKRKRYLPRLKSTFSSEHFPFLFQAYERRFPTCHLIPMFVASDVVDEENSEDGSTQKIERRCALDVDAPRLLKRVWCIYIC